MQALRHDMYLLVTKWTLYRFIRKPSRESSYIMCSVYNSSMKMFKSKSVHI